MLKPSPGPTTILLVDDNPTVRASSRLLLETSNRGEFKVLACENGRQALETFKSQIDTLAVVVLDMQLPDCDGAQLFLRMRQLAPNIPIIAVSGMSRGELAACFEEHQPDEMLIKPFDADDFVTTLIEVVEERAFSSC